SPSLLSSKSSVLTMISAAWAALVKASTNRIEGIMSRSMVLSFRGGSAVIGGVVPRAFAERFLVGADHGRPDPAVFLCLGGTHQGFGGAAGAACDFRRQLARAIATFLGNPDRGLDGVNAFAAG